MKMKKQEVLNLQQGLLSVGNLTGVKFSYAIARNINSLKGEIDSIKKAAEMSEGFKEYENARVALAEKHALRDNGEPKIVGDKYQIKDRSAFDEEFKALREANKEKIEARDKQLKDFESLLDEETDVELFMLSQENIPELITSKQLIDIMPIVKE